MLIVMRRRSVLDEDECKQFEGQKYSPTLTAHSIKYRHLFDYRHAIRKFLTSRLSRIPKKFEEIWNKRTYWFAYLEDP